MLQYCNFYCQPCCNSSTRFLIWQYLLTIFLSVSIETPFLFSLIVVINLLNSLQVHPGGYLILFQLLIVVIYCDIKGRTLFWVAQVIGDFRFRRKNLYANYLQFQIWYQAFGEKVLRICLIVSLHFWPS